jgi:serine/threonine-protein kinase
MPFLPGDELGGSSVGPAVYALSPDGTMLVYRHVVDGKQVLVVRRWAELAATPIRGTENGASPFVSPDGLEVAFQQGQEVKVLAFAGGPVRTLASGFLTRWGRDGYVYFSMPPDFVVGRVPPAGGVVDTLLVPDSGHVAGVSDILPGGRKALLFEGVPPDSSYEIVGLDLESGERTAIVSGVYARYLPSGHLVSADTYTGRMMAAPFDPRSMKLLAAPVPVMEGLSGWSLSDDGKLFYTLAAAQPAAPERQMIWVDRKGQATPVDPDWTWQSPGSDDAWSLSPDGSRMALRERTADGADVWIKRLDAGPRSRLTDDGADERSPVWRPGTDEVTWVGGQLTQVWTRRADGVGEAKLLVETEQEIATIDWSPDGTWLLLRTVGPRGSEGGRDILGFRPGADTVPMSLLADSTYDELNQNVSPDGRFIAYQSRETDRHEIYVRPFPDVTAGKWQVSVSGGRWPRWSPLGNELFFQGPNSEMMVARVRIKPAFHADAPVRLFEGDADWWRSDITGHRFVVAPDGQRFLMARTMPAPAQDDEEQARVRAVLVNNFIEELKARVPIR